MRVSIEGDTLRVTMLKEWTYEAALDYIQLLDTVRAKSDTLFFIVDSGQTQKLPEERIRRMLATWTAKHTFSGLAMVGLPPLMRAIASLIFHAANMFRPGSAPYTFTKDEESARRWVAERRAALADTRRDPHRG